MSFENNLYCDFNATAAAAVAGKDILLCVFDANGSNLLAVAGQQGLTINRSSDSIEVSSKDTPGGWKSKISGMKEWSIDNDGLYVGSHASHKAIGAAFNDANPVCIKIVNMKTKKAMFGGLAYVTEYTLEAPYDDAMTYSISLEGNGALVDLSENAGSTMMPETAKPRKYTQEELNKMTKSAIAAIAIDRDYKQVSEDETKAQMITKFLQAQG